MKTLRNYLEQLGMLLCALILFQSCVVYQKTPVTLAQAADANKKAKVEMKSHETYRFKSIALENGQYYGLQKAHNDPVKVPLDADGILKIRLQDKSASTQSTVFLGIVAVGVPVIIYVVSINSIEASGMGWD